MKFINDDILLPADIRYNNEYSSAQKMMAGMLLNYYKDNLFYKELILELTDELKYNQQYVKKSVDEILKLHYFHFEEFTDEDKFNLLNNKKLKGQGKGYLKCEWCGISTMSLESHHYPIPSKDGGEETVDICPNCHSEFHTIVGRVEIIEERKARKHIKEVNFE